MPLHEYQCMKCKHRFEKIQKFSARPVKKCPQCGGPVEQLLSAPAVRFKGSGFYSTDYPRKGASGEAASNGSKPEDAGAGAKTAEKSETKKSDTAAESKAAPKTETKSKKEK